MKQTAYLIVIFLSFFSGRDCCAQQITDQSDPKKLWNEIVLAKTDTTKVKALINYGDYWIARNQDSVLKYFDLAQKLAFKTNNLNLQEWSIEKFNVYYQNIGDYQSFIKNGKKLLIFSNKNNLIGGQIRACLAIGTGYYSAGDIQKYLDYHILAQKIAEKHNLLLKYPNIPYNIGEALNQMGQPEKAKPYFYESIELCKKAKDDFYLAVSYYNLAVYFSGQNKFDSSFVYHTKSLEVCKKINYDQLIAVNYGSLANNLYELKKPNEGLKMANLGLQTSEKSQFLVGKIIAYLGLYQNYYGLNNLSKAIETGEIANNFITKNKLEAEYYKEFELLSEINLKANRPEKAYEYLKKYKTWADSISNKDVKTKIGLIETQYKTEKKEKQIQSLQAEKKIQNLQLKQRNIWLYGLLGAILAFSIFGYQYYKNSKRKELLAFQTTQLQEQKIKELQQEKQIIGSNSVIKGQEEERSRLAKDLHDGLGGILSGIKLTLNSMTGNQVLSEQNSNTFHRAIGQLDNAISELRRVAHSMMPEALLKFGLSDALQDYCEGINGSGLLKVNFEAWGVEGRQEQSLEVTLYRIVQELLNNTIKHSGATYAHVQLVQNENMLTLTVEDNGKGFDLESLKTNKGAGISNVESRVAYLNGKMDIKSDPSHGTSVEIQVEV
jgi:two-component system, NarL family, sensor kinase